jgi:lipopolysaccharide transport system ATP-binding protein
MSDIAVKVENLGKSYLVGHNAAQGERYTALRDVITHNAKNLVRKTRDMFQGKAIIQGDEVEEFWALKNINFEIRQGDRVGIIGRNGAGKSTLLKILSRITEPTTGRITLNGRVSSLLEVGTGFHPELSGRENIFLNGAILGMGRKEIQSKFDEIVDFAEVEKFLDTPVKRYSSGMYVRLAFAVAAHLEPEILIVDEVLAVGDAQFQKKCLGKMEDVAEAGRTVLFVSHNMAALANICSRAVLLSEGIMISDGDVDKVVKEYVSSHDRKVSETVWHDIKNAPGGNKIRLHSVRITSEGEVVRDIQIEKEICVEIEYWNLYEGAVISVSIHLLDEMGSCVFASGTSKKYNLAVDEWYGKPFLRGLYRTKCVIPAHLLNNGKYKISLFILYDSTICEVHMRELLYFNANESGAFRDDYLGQIIGVIRPKLSWTTELIQKGF